MTIFSHIQNLSVWTALDMLEWRANKPAAVDWRAKQPPQVVGVSKYFKCWGAPLHADTKPSVLHLWLPRGDRQERGSTWCSPLRGWERALCCQSDWHCSWFQGNAGGTEIGQSACWLSKGRRYQLELNSTVSCDTCVKVSVTWQHMGLTGCSASSVWLGGQLVPQLLFRAGLEPAEDSTAVSRFHPCAHCVTTCRSKLGWELILQLCGFVFIFHCDGFIDSFLLFSFVSWWLAKKLGYVTELLAVREQALLY